MEASILADFDHNPARFIERLKKEKAEFDAKMAAIDPNAFADAFCFPNSGNDTFPAIRRNLRNRKEIPDSGEKEQGRSLLWVLKWQERRAKRKERKLSAHKKGKLDKEGRIESYGRQKLHNPEHELVFIEDEARIYRAHLNFVRILSSIPCVPDDMKITNDD